ncbi:hypothetical protein MMC25_007833 [Agyrium rufum]|nr:hypothetical protein [Agyrium rufum]
MAGSNFKKPPQAPPLFVATPSSVVADMKRIIEEDRKKENEYAKSIKPEEATFDTVLLPMAHDQDKMALEVNILGFYQAVSTDSALRDASTEADKLMSDYGIESSMREDMFALVDAVYQKKPELETESQLLLEKSRKVFIQYGLGLPAGAQRERFKVIKKRLSDLAITFQKNLNEENGGIWFTRDELEGIPDNVLETLAVGEGENKGKLRLTFKYPDYFPTIKYAKKESTRREVRMQYENKNMENVPLFKETMVLRDEAARMLGYPNHAAFAIEDKMAKTTEWVDHFLGDLRERLTKGGREEVAHLTEYKQKDMTSQGLGKEYDGRFYMWDHYFYNRIMEEEEFKVDQQKISEWFPLSSTIRGMLQIFEDLFGMVFVEIVGEDRAAISTTGKGDDVVWHPDVQMFSVWDDEGEGGEFIGYLYLDLHPRDGKYGHAANFNIQPGFIQPNGSRRYPATSLVCNFSKPTPKQPSLLKHDEVVTLFHELGHGIHDLVGRTKYSRFHGTATTQDFVEAPSQMLENWCWTPSQLKSLSNHYSTLSDAYLASWKESAPQGQETPSKQLPDDLISSLVATRHVNGALFNLRQLHFGIFDMAVHEPASHDVVEKMDMSIEYNRLRSEIVPMDGPEADGEPMDWGHGQATFGHLMGGYDAGYYGYLASQVYSLDMFYSVFAKDPMNPEEGRRYRHGVLEKGGSQPEMKTLTDFLGRAPTTDAFYKELGIAK